MQEPMNPSIKELTIEDPQSPSSKKKLLSETTSTGIPAFPWRLHEMLNDSERKAFDNVVSWQPCGRAFRVHDIRIFADSILPNYFNQSQYKSFQRQLNIYGFTRLISGSAKGAYTHDLFIRGKPEICRFMVRTKIKRKGSRSNIMLSNTPGEKVCPRRTSSCPDTLRNMTMQSSTSLNATWTSSNNEIGFLATNNDSGSAAISVGGKNNQQSDRYHHHDQTATTSTNSIFSLPARKGKQRNMRRLSSTDISNGKKPYDIQSSNFAPSSHYQKPTGLLCQGILGTGSAEDINDPMDMDLDSIFDDPPAILHPEVSISVPSELHGKQANDQNSIAPDVADEIIRMFA